MSMLQRTPRHRLQEAIEPVAYQYSRVFTLPRALILFLALFILAATLYQIRSPIPPWKENAPIDLMNGSLIWMCSATALLMAAIARKDPVRSLMWFLGCGALAFVALDEIFGIHEKVRTVMDDDDPKIVMALIAAFALAVLIKVQRVKGLPRTLLLIGFGFHFIYLMSDLGDGDFFNITFGYPDVLRWLEEYLEVTAMSFYFSGFALILEGEMRLGSVPHKT
jgi:hypothetical protein